MGGFSDVMEDYPLLDYLFLGRLPSDEGEVSRIRKLAGVYRAHGKEVQVSVWNSLGQPVWVNVPPVPMRQDIVRDTHEALGHIGHERLLGSLREWYWWPGMARQVRGLLKSCTTC